MTNKLFSHFKKEIKKRKMTNTVLKKEMVAIKQLITMSILDDLRNPRDISRYYPLGQKCIIILSLRFGCKSHLILIFFVVKMSLTL